MHDGQILRKQRPPEVDKLLRVDLAGFGHGARAHLLIEFVAVLVQHRVGVAYAVDFVLQAEGNDAVFFEHMKGQVASGIGADNKAIHGDTLLGG